MAPATYFSKIATNVAQVTQICLIKARLRVVIMALTVSIADASVISHAEASANKKEFSPEGLAMHGDTARLKIIPLFAAVEALKSSKLDTKSKRRLLRMATRVSRHPDAADAAAIVAPAILESIRGRDDDEKFLQEWYWHLGVNAVRNGDKAAAADFFGRVPAKSPHAARAQYQMALFDHESGQLESAVNRLKGILGAKSAPSREIEDLSKLALARIYYGQKKYQSSAAVYRTVSREGLFFGSALFEQAWAFFMGGYPKQALGALHGAESPFFQDTFNPEATLLRSMILYWMCLYPSSETALKEFIARHSDEIASLEQFLARQRLTPRAAWELFENLFAGVSSESLGISRTLLMTAAAKDGMKPVRNAYASAKAEMVRLQSGKISLQDDYLDRALDMLKPYISDLEERLGQRFINSLTEMQSSYASLRDQADFLYLELLTSEKDKLLGKEHLAQAKFGANSTRSARPKGWGKSLLAWRGDDKQEFWWDEVGFYIATVDPVCSK